ncbi:hypothetical protein [Amaricoccus sp.]|mgnify:CR=1 FL=1|uniref:hypothetical protein n=1 Tax=Amaricoccus sp. TaxID=1872485 RepID=UPI002624DB39|nr:hypothetical protein [Amaricoccus sp.]HRO11158.1 hypothetical protein [Amaricoccus sp.]
MSQVEPSPREDSAETSYLDDYRAAVERLRGETVAEVGGQPMPPEKASMLAVLAAALPLLAVALHPAVPVEPNGLQEGLALLAVWLVAFRVQSPRYARFHACWHRKIAAHQAAEVRAVARGGGILGGR